MTPSPMQNWRARAARTLAHGALLIILALTVACGGAPATATPPPAPTAEARLPQPTEEPWPTATAPAPTPTRSASTPRPSPTATVRPTNAPPRPTATPGNLPTQPPIAVGNGPAFARAGLAGQAVATIVAGGKEGRLLYAGGKGLSRSTDGGKSWAVVRTEKEAPRVAAVAIAPSNPLIVYVGVSEGCGKGKPLPGFVTIDGGATWKQTGKNLSSFAVDGRDPQRVYATDCTGLQLTLDGGATWEPVAGLPLEDLTPVAVAVAPIYTQNLYVVTSGEGGAVAVRRSRNGGTTWEATAALPEGTIGPLSFAIDPANVETIFLSTLVGLFHSVNGGAKWTQLTEGGLEATAPARPPANAPDGFRLTTALLLDPDRRSGVWVGTGSGKAKGIGVLRTLDGGKTWERTAAEIDGRLVQALAIGGVPEKRVLYVATDDGIWALNVPPADEE